MKPQVSHDWEGLRQLCRRLRAPGGCNWDRDQTVESLTPYFIEEAYEVLEACAQRDPRRIAEELGDLLYLIVFAVTIAEEESRFTFEEVAGTIVRKLIARHPHVFGATEEELDFQQARQQWESLKKDEKRKRGDSTETLAVGARALPALLLAYRVQEKAASFGFDWPDLDGVVKKLAEEQGELERACAQPQSRMREAAAEEETGDLLFTLVNLARHLGRDPEQLLRRSVGKFRARFARMEQILEAGGTPLRAADLETMEHAWQLAKRDPGAAPVP